MNVTTVGIQKGGVGKTTVLVGLAEALTEKGANVLAIDTDAQCNLSQWLTGKSGTGEYQDWVDLTVGGFFYRDLREQDPGRFREAVVETPIGVDLIPANPFQNSPIEKHSSFTFLRERIQELEEDAQSGAVEPYDVVLVDTPPFIGGALWNAVSASDGLIVPVTLEGLPLEGLNSFLGALKQAPSGVDRIPALTGIIVNRVDIRLGTTEDGQRLLDSQFKEALFSRRVRDRVDITRASTAKRSILNHGGDHAAEVFPALADEFLERTDVQL